MAYSPVNHVGDGTETDFTLDFSYIQKAHVKALVDGTETEFTWASPSSIRFDTAPSSGAVVLIYRDSSVNSLLPDFADGRNLASEALDISALQAFYLAQERSFVTATGRFDVSNVRALTLVQQDAELSEGEVAAELKCHAVPSDAYASIGFVAESPPGSLGVGVFTGRAGGPDVEWLRVSAGGTVRPSTDNTQPLGRASFRWSELYAGTGTINTSDERDKQQIRAITEAERRVAFRLKSLIRAFKFNNAVDKKGSEARTHFGVIAQQVVEAFTAENLDPFSYALLCYDEWPEQPEFIDDKGTVVQPYRPAGNRYGVRYDELLAFIITAM